MLSAQCTDERVNKVTPELFRRYPTPDAMARAPLPSLEKIIRSTGFFKQKAKSLKGTAAGILALLGLAGTATASLITGWLMPVLIVVSLGLLARSFYILYVSTRGTRVTAIVTWLSAAFVIGY